MPQTRSEYYWEQWEDRTLGFEAGALVGCSVGGDGMLAAFWTSFRLDPVELATRRIFPLV